jgi:hypothetical protein
MTIVNKVAQSGLVTLKLEDYAPNEPIASFDIADHLFKGLLLREKDFRAVVAEHDWAQYAGQYLAVYCSADAIIPVWAYMLVAISAEPHALGVYEGEPTAVESRILLENLATLDAETLRDARVVVKGCADRPIPEAAFLEVARKLQPVVRSLMYGEPCSTVPLYKRKNP